MNSRWRDGSDAIRKQTYVEQRVLIVDGAPECASGQKAGEEMDHSYVHDDASSWRPFCSLLFLVMCGHDCNVVRSRNAQYIDRKVVTCRFPEATTELLIGAPVDYRVLFCFFFFCCGWLWKYLPDKLVAHANQPATNKVTQEDATATKSEAEPNSTPPNYHSESGRLDENLADEAHQGWW